MTVLLFSCESENKHRFMEPNMSVKSVDLSGYTAQKPSNGVHLLFIHHSTGGQLLASKGPDVGQGSIYMTHPNGGGLRKLLEQNNYKVHEASYGSILGDSTDICHWNAKFRGHMDQISPVEVKIRFSLMAQRTRSSFSSHVSLITG
jgi:hypothetical protein